MSGVERLRATAARFPTDQSEADGTATWDATTVVVVQADADGLTGTGYSYTAAAAADVVHELLAPVVVGTDPLDVPAAHVAMAHAVRNVGGGGLVGAALSAVDCALWDLKARLLAVPMSALLGRVRDEVPLYGSGGFTTYDASTLRAQLRHWVNGLGLSAVKIKIGESWGSRTERDLERVRQVREEVGDDIDVMVDANGGYTVGQAVRVARTLADLDVVWFEEPVSSDDLAGLRAVRGQSLSDVAAGEYADSLPYVAAMVSAGAVDCMQLDITRIGGVTSWLRAAAVAQAHGLQVSAHCAPALHAPVLLAVPNLRHQELFHDHVRIESALFPGSLEVVDGRLRLAPGPGNGLVMDGDELDRHAVGSGN